MLDEIIQDTKETLAKVKESYKRELTRLRTGRANLAILDGIRVEYYGTMTPLNQVAALNIADPRLITIKPWDKSLLIAIEKAIVGSNIGITPGSDGEIIRLPIPPLTGEVRKNLVKELKKKTEDARVAARNARRDANQLVKEAEMAEDDEARALKQIQKLLDDTVAELEGDGEAKEKEIMEI